MKNLFPHIQLVHSERLHNKLIGDDPITDHDRYFVEKDQLTVIDFYGERLYIVLKRGNIDDGASVPGIATFLGSLDHDQIGPEGILKDPSSLHDAFYKRKGVVTKTDELLQVFSNPELTKRLPVFFTREEVDWIYYLMLHAANDRVINDPDNPDGTAAATEKQMFRVYKMLDRFGWTKWNKTAAKSIHKISAFINKIRNFFRKK